MAIQFSAGESAIDLRDNSQHGWGAALGCNVANWPEADDRLAGRDASLLPLALLPLGYKKVYDRHIVLDVKGLATPVDATGVLRKGKLMKEKRRIGTAQSATHTAILDAAQKLMIEDGYAAVSARRVAVQAGIKPALVQYYFPTMDMLLLTLYRRAADLSIDNQVIALASPQPLRALWVLSSDARQAALAIEFMALANHRKSIQAEIARYSKRSRHLQAEALSTILRGTRFASSAFSAIGVSLILAGVARGLVMEEGLGIGEGHPDARAIVEIWLNEVEPTQ
jgi:AcrR family transcriptional regulator